MADINGYNPAAPTTGASGGNGGDGGNAESGPATAVPLAPAVSGQLETTASVLPVGPRRRRWCRRFAIG